MGGNLNTPHRDFSITMWIFVPQNDTIIFICECVTVSASIDTYSIVVYYRQIAATLVQ